MTDQLLYSREKAMKLLGLGEKAFDAYNFPYVPPPPGKKRKKYIIDQLKQHLINSQKNACPLGKEEKSTPTISRSMVIGFAEAVKRTTSDSQRP